MSVQVLQKHVFQNVVPLPLPLEVPQIQVLSKTLQNEFVKVLHTTQPLLHSLLMVMVSLTLTELVLKVLRNKLNMEMKVKVSLISVNLCIQDVIN